MFLLHYSLISLSHPHVPVLTQSENPFSTFHFLFLLIRICYFGIISGLYYSCKDSTESSIYLSPVFLNVKISPTHGTMTRIKKLTTSDMYIHMSVLPRIPCKEDYAHVFTYCLLFVTLWTRVYSFSDLSPHPVLCYLFHCSNIPSCGHWELVHTGFRVPWTCPHPFALEHFLLSFWHQRCF